MRKIVHIFLTISIILFIFVQESPNGQSSETYILIGMLSASKNVHIRNFQRELFKKAVFASHVKASLVFVLGRPKNQKHWKKIAREKERFADLFIADQVENYGQLLSVGLNFISSYAANHLRSHSAKKKFYFKTDDDVFLRYSLLSLSISRLPAKSTYFGQIAPNFHFYSPAQRNRMEYLHDTLPLFALGTGYGMSYDLVEAAASYKHAVINSDSGYNFLNEDSGISVLFERIGLRIENVIHFPGIYSFCLPKFSIKYCDTIAFHMGAKGHGAVGEVSKLDRLKEFNRKFGQFCLETTSTKSVNAHEIQNVSLSRLIASGCVSVTGQGKEL